MGFGAFTGAGTLDEADLLVLEQAGSTRKLTLAALTEFGSWTPTVVGDTTAGSVTYSTQDGEYVKIGRLVVAWFAINLSGTHSGTGNVNITGLPFSSAGGLVQIRTHCAVMNTTYPSTATQTFVQLPPNDNKLVVQATGSGLGTLALGISDLTTTSVFRGHTIYHT